MDVGGIGVVKRNAHAILITLGALAGAGGCDPGPVTATVTVERLVPGMPLPTGDASVAPQTQDGGAGGESCFAPCSGSAAPNDAIVVGDRCADASPTACGFLGGTDQMRVVVDYGNVNISTPSSFTGPPLQLVGDGTVLTNTTLVPGVLAQGDQRPYAYGVLQVPDTNVFALVVQASPGGGDTVRAPATFTVTAQPGTMTLPGCATPCTATLQVGTLSVTVTAASNVPAQTATIQSVVDNVPQAAGLQIPLMPIGNNMVSGTQALAVPASGTIWTLNGYIGTLSLGSEQIALQRPSIVADLQGCLQTDGGVSANVGPCPVTAGGTASLSITAPANSEITAVTVVTTVDGVNTGTVFSGTLMPCDNKVDCTVVPVTVTGPPGHAWAAQATVGIFNSLPVNGIIVAAPSDAGSPDAGSP
jgi:hypothetical protein